MVGTPSLQSRLEGAISGNIRNLFPKHILCFGWTSSYTPSFYRVWPMCKWSERLNIREYSWSDHKSYSLRMRSDKNLSRLSWLDASFNLKLVLSGSEKRFKLFGFLGLMYPGPGFPDSGWSSGEVGLYMNLLRIPNFDGTIYYDVKHDGTQRDFQIDAHSMVATVIYINDWRSKKNVIQKHQFENPAQLWFHWINHEQIQQQYRGEVRVHNHRSDPLRDLIPLLYRFFMISIALIRQVCGLVRT